MKKIFAVASFFALGLTFVPTAFAQISMCNQSCDVDSDCGSSYRCYVGVCRLDACPAVSNCSCSGTQGAPTSTPKALPYRTPASTPAATQKNVASIAGSLSETPKTGFDTWGMAGFSALLFLIGSGVLAAQKLQQADAVSPRELVRRRLSSKQ